MKKPMSYQQAARRRKKGFVSSLTEKLISGQGVGSSIKATISEGSQARMKGIKEKFDPMNIVKFMTGGSKLAAALYGNLAGRSKEDMKYFAGERARNVGAKATKIDSLGGSDEVLDILGKIYTFLQNSYEIQARQREEESTQKESIDLKKQRRHDELIKALTGKKPSGKGDKATKVKPEEDTGGFFGGLIDLVKGLISSAIEGVMAIIDSFKNVFNFVKGLMNLATFGRFIGLLMNPTMLGLLAIFGGIAALRALLFQLADVTPNMKVLTPSSAAAILESGSDKDIKDYGGKEYLEDVVKNGRVRAEQILNMPETTPEEKEQKRIAIRDAGGRSQLEKIAADTTEYKVPERVVAEKVIPPRPTGGGTRGALKKKQWDEMYGENYNPDATPKSVTTPATPVSMPPSSPLEEKTKQLNEANLPAPAPTVKSETTNNTSVQANKKVVKPPPIPAVRNLESSFQDMILYSTRVV